MIEILNEFDILNSPMFEMANLFPNVTGIPYAIWFGEVGGQHGPRIKVSNIKGKFAANDNFVIVVSKEPWIATPKSCKLSKSEMDDIFDWIILNYDILMDMWQMYENGGYLESEPELTLLDIQHRLKKI